jgi:hypothetical protein
LIGNFGLVSRLARCGTLGRVARELVLQLDQIRELVGLAP